MNRTVRRAPRIRLALAAAVAAGVMAPLGCRNEGEGAISVPPKDRAGIMSRLGDYPTPAAKQRRGAKADAQDGNIKERLRKE